MANKFASGATAISQGVVDVNITGLNLAFVPATVTVSMRMPNENADIISANIVGTPTADGFAISLSAPPTEAGYILDWMASVADYVPPPTPLAIQPGYETFRAETARYLGYDPSNLSAMEENAVDACVQSGVRQFYYPPAIGDGSNAAYEWTFLRQGGTVAATAGVGDYVLPDGFGRIAGPILASDGMHVTEVRVIPEGTLNLWRGNDAHAARPGFAAVSFTLPSYTPPATGASGQLKVLKIYPVPDKAYTLSFNCDAIPEKLDATTNKFPLGGPMFTELVLESCLAVAEQRVNDEAGLHTQNFQSMLASFIERDRKTTAQVFGQIGDPEHRRMW